jgi:hypothetical protein
VQRTEQQPVVWKARKIGLGYNTRNLLLTKVFGWLAGWQQQRYIGANCRVSLPREKIIEMVVVHADAQQRVSLSLLVEVMDYLLDLLPVCVV